ncbi:hypothetical protein VPZ60_004224 [Salmonella enterica]|nr:hypothetical protein [Salmonella enterica]
MTDESPIVSEEVQAITTDNPYKTIVDVFLRPSNFEDKFPAVLDVVDEDFKGVLRSAAPDESASLETYVMLLRHESDPAKGFLVVHFNHPDLKTVPFILPVERSDAENAGEDCIMQALSEMAASENADEYLEHPIVPIFFALTTTAMWEDSPEVVLTPFGRALAQVITRALATQPPAEAVH